MPILDRVLIDVNVILDYFNRVRRRKYPFSVEFMEFVLKNDETTKFISSSSLDNIAFIKNKELKEAYPKMPIEIRKRIIKAYENNDSGRVAYWLDELARVRK